MIWVKRLAMFFGGLLLAGVTTLWALGKRQDAGHVDASVEINRPPDVVWKWLVEPELQKKWVGWLKEVEVVNEKRVVWIMSDPNNGAEMRVPFDTTEMVAHKRLAGDTKIEGSFSGSAAYALEDLGGGKTRCSLTSKYTYDHWFASLMEPVVSREASRKAVADLARMKELIERVN